MTITDEQIAAAKAVIEKSWDDSGACRSCGWHGAMYEHQIEDWEIVWALEKNAGILDLGCVAKDREGSDSHRGVRINLRPETE